MQNKVCLDNDSWKQILSFVDCGSSYKVLCLVSRDINHLIKVTHPNAMVVFANPVKTLEKLWNIQPPHQVRSCWKSYEENISVHDNISLTECIVPPEKFSEALENGIIPSWYLETEERTLDLIDAISNCGRNMGEFFESCPEYLSDAVVKKLLDVYLSTQLSAYQVDILKLLIHSAYNSSVCSIETSRYIGGSLVFDLDESKICLKEPCNVLVWTMCDHANDSTVLRNRFGRCFRIID